MYEKYIKERQGLEEIKTDFGFIHFRINKKTCFIADWYVLPDFRGSKKGYELADEVVKVAEINECSHLLCQVDLDTNNATQSLKSILGYGFKLINAQQNVIELYKEIGE